MFKFPSPLRDAVRKAFASKFGPARDDRLIRPGETLADATARRWGIPLREPVAPRDVPMPVPNRSDRRDEHKRADVLASYSRQLTARKVSQ